MSRPALVKLVGLALLLLAVHAGLASRFGAESDAPIMRWTWVEVVIYALAVFVVLRDERRVQPGRRGALAFILVVAAILRVMLVPIDPVSTDINRYIWDGRVQAAGINPYLYVPADPALKSLRDDDIYTEINRKDYARTIYPPLAEIVFYLVTRWDEDVAVMKAAMVAFEAVAILALLALLAARGLPLTRILLYAWHPLPIWEIAGSGHVDAIAIACVTLALLAAERRKPALAGIALGGAALVKFFPAAVGPALYRRWDWKLPAAGLATIVLLYLPYIGAGRQVFGFLNGYGDEEGYGSGWGFYLLVLAQHLVPTMPAYAATLYKLLAAAVLGGLGLALLLRRRGSGADIAGAFMLATAFTVVTSPHYPWYLAWLVPFLCFIPSWPVIWLTGSATLMYIIKWPPSFAAGSFYYLPFFALLAVDAIIRHGKRDETILGLPT